MAKMGWISAVIVGIVALIMVVTIVGSTASVVDDAAEDITQDSRCAAVGCTYNETESATESCRNQTGSGTAACSLGSHTNIAYPLEGLFNTGGIVILMFIGAALVTTVAVAWIKLRK